LFQSDHFYHAALALSAYHRRMILSSDLSQQSSISAVIQQEKSLEACIRLLDQTTHQSSCGAVGLGVGFAVVQLTFYEVIESIRELKLSY